MRDVAALVEIGMKNRDVQALLYAHRIIHNVDSFVINAPDDGEEYSAAKLAESAAYIEKHKGRVGISRPFFFYPSLNHTKGTIVQRKKTVKPAPLLGLPYRDNVS